MRIHSTMHNFTEYSSIFQQRNDKDTSADPISTSAISVNKDMLASATKRDAIAEKPKMDPAEQQRIFESLKDVNEKIKYSLKSSTEPLLEQLAKFEQEYKEAAERYGADSPNLVSLENVILGAREGIQKVVDSVTEFYSVLKGASNLPGNSGNRSLRESAKDYVKLPEGIDADIMDVSSKGLGIDKLEGGSANIRRMLEKAYLILDAFSKAMSDAFKDSIANPHRYTLDIKV